MKISTIRKKALKTLRESRDLSELSKIHKDLLGKKGTREILEKIGTDEKELKKLLK